jgi:hypothetical protein
MGNGRFRNVEGIGLEVDGVDDNSAWRGRPFFNYCNQMFCPAAVYPVVYDCAVTQPSPTRMACFISSFLGTEP